VGDVVALLDTKERGRYPLARVIHIVTDKRDGHVRSATIRLASSERKLGTSPKILERNINRLMLLIPSDSKDESHTD
jgi:hypothetical protein